ncbi:MAG: ribonuclease HII [Endomicrobiia bacterium]|nr:ribonuclease HII [Endomicrobiia bacterium]
MSPLYFFDEVVASERGISSGVVMAGVDEAGRGPLAGPVAVAAVALDRSRPIPGVNDSKKLSARKREELFMLIRANAVAVSAAVSSHRQIDRVGILRATFAACRRAARGLEKKLGRRRLGLVIFDGNLEIPGLGVPQITVVGGDGLSASTAAASIIAKVTRDRIMTRLDKKYRDYGFAKHKGYGTREHIAAIKKIGACSVHRKTFLKNIV